MAQAKVLTAADFEKLLAHCATTRAAARNRCIVFMQHHAALRISEIAVLTLENVLHADGTLKDELRFTAAQVKERRDGAVPISSKLAVELQQYLHADFKKLQSRGGVWAMDAALFPSSTTRTTFSVNALTQVVNALYKRAGIAGGTTHSGRRTAITLLANKGIPVRQLQAFARHANIATTQRYIDCNVEQVRRAVELL